MKSEESKIITIKKLVSLGELILLNFCFILTYALSHKSVEWSNLFDTISKPLFVYINLTYAICLSYVGIVLDQRIVTAETILNKVTKTCALFSLVVLVIVTFISNNVFSPSHWAFFILSFFCCACVWRMGSRIMLKKYRSSGRNYKQIIILGAGNIANELHSTISLNSFYGYKFLGFFDDRAPDDYKVDAELVKGKLDDVYEFATSNHVDEIYCALPAGDDRKALPIIKFAEKNMIRCFLVPDFKRFIKKQVSLSFLGDMQDAIPIISLREEPLLSPQNMMVKRLFDIVFSFLFLVTLFPILFIILAPLIKLSSKGPIFFRQMRTGKDGEDFACYKFRTMTVNDSCDTQQATKGDARITPIGAFMRKTNLDEMPQFFNVLIGNMSVVGPRPHMLSQTKKYSELINEYMVRHFAKPGITGWAQVTGFRGETQTIEEMEGRVKRDVWYIENWTFWLDMKIIFLTVFNMIKGDDKAY